MSLLTGSRQNGINSSSIARGKSCTKKKGSENISKNLFTHKLILRNIDLKNL
jgi:hypothetical protein